MTKEQIRRLRRRLLLEQRDLARMAGVSQAAISQIERGTRNSESMKLRLVETLEAERIRQGLPASFAA